jgi:hypothetical protein
MDFNSIPDAANGSTCKKCFDNCRSCLDLGPFNCTSCKENHVFDYYDRTCSKKCYLHQYYNYSIGLCMRCPPNCVMCQNSTSCDLCSVDKKLIKGKCRSKCEENFYEVPFEGKGICKKCLDSNCRSCPYNGVCKSCNFEYVLDEENHTCIKACNKTGFWLEKVNDSSRRCRPCVKNCKSCSSKTCDECFYGYVKIKNRCRPKKSNL